MLRAAACILGLGLFLSPARAAVTSPTSVIPGAKATKALLTSFSALNAKKALDGIRIELSLRLKGRGSTSLDDISAGLDAVEAGLSDRSMLPAEAAALRPEVRELRGLLSLARSGSGYADLGRLHQVRTALGPDAGSDGIAGALGAAARNPDSVARVFDNNRFSAVVSAPAMPSASGPSAQAPVSVSSPKPKVKDIDLKVPDLDVERISRHVVRLTDGLAGKSVLEVGLATLSRLPDSKARLALSREIASEVTAALGKKDSRLAEALAEFLRDIGEYLPAGTRAVHLNVDDRNHLSLIFERGDGSRRILAGQFLPSSQPDGRPGRTGFIILRPIEVTPSGVPRQDHPGYWREYLGGDRRQEWTSTTEDEEKGWGLWSRQNELQKVWLAQQVWVDGRWQDEGRRNVKTLTAKEGKSWFGRTGDAVMKTPGVGHALKFCDDVGATLFTGIAAAPQVLITAVSGSDTYSIEAAGSYAHNPLMRALVHDQGYLDRLTRGARRELFAKVRENRLLALQTQPFPLPPEVMRQAVDAPISAKEAVATLRNDYGMGSYGRRLVLAGAEEEGWKSHALKGAGVATGVFENVGDAVFNPIMWATMGARETVAAIKGTQALASGAVGAKAALTAVSITHKLATVAWWGPWLLSATDNAGRLVQLTNDRKFDKDFLKNVEDVSADILYLFLIP